MLLMLVLYLIYDVVEVGAVRSAISLFVSRCLKRILRILVTHLPSKTPSRLSLFSCVSSMFVKPTTVPKGRWICTFSVVYWCGE